MRTPEIVRVPGWERFGWLRAGFSTRRSGVSGAYGSGELNLGWTREDDAEAVKQNRDAFVREVGDGAAVSLVTVGQVHGSTVRVLEQETAPWMTDDGRARLEGDGLIKQTAGNLLAILTADCVPVLVADTRLRAVGAFHAGWRGTLAHIVACGVASMRDHYGSQPEDLMAAIGPCIGACCFQIGPEVREAFMADSPDSDSLFHQQPEGSVCMDLVEANRRELTRMGVPHDAIWAAGLCTACARSEGGGRRFFSYRSEGGVTGRMLSAIGVAG